MKARVFGSSVLVALALLLAATGSVTRIANAAIDYFYGVEVVDAAALSELRGKYVVPGTGLEVDIGINIETMVNNIKLSVLQRLTERGIVTESIKANLAPEQMLAKTPSVQETDGMGAMPKDTINDIKDMMPAMTPEPKGGPSGNTVPQQQDNVGVAAAVKKIEVINSGKVTGLKLTDSTGITAVTTKTSNGTDIVTLINNTADKRDISQFVRFDMNVRGFHKFTGNLRQALRMNQMQRGLTAGGQLRP